MRLCNRTPFVDVYIDLLWDGSKQIAGTSENEIRPGLILWTLPFESQHLNFEMVRQLQGVLN